MTSHADLKRLAEAAMPGPWQITHDYWNGCNQCRSVDVNLNREFICAANPAQVLALLDEIEYEKRNGDAFETEHQKIHDGIWSVLLKLGKTPKPCPHHDLDYCVDEIKERTDALLERIARLEKIEDAAKEFRTAYAINRDVGGGRGYELVIQREIELITALASAEQETK